MISFLGFLASLVIVGIIACLVIWFALGAMHQHLKNKGEGFGRDDELHAKIDTIMEKQNAVVTTKH